MKDFALAALITAFIVFLVIISVLTETKTSDGAGGACVINENKNCVCFAGHGAINGQAATGAEMACGTEAIKALINLRQTQKGDAL